MYSSELVSLSLSLQRNVRTPGGVHSPGTGSRGACAPGWKNAEPRPVICSADALQWMIFGNLGSLSFIPRILSKGCRAEFDSEAIYTLPPVEHNACTGGAAHDESLRGRIVIEGFQTSLEIPV